MIDIYDGNNVMRRDIEKPQPGAARPMSLRMRYEQTCYAPAGSQIWVWDGFAHNERRQEIYPPYKGNRTPSPENIFAQINLWKEILTFSPATQMEVYGWEADDVIATMVREFGKSGIPVRVHSNDMDYAQLEHYPNVTLNGVNSKGIEGQWVPLYKALRGDSSDNIKGIPGFGDGAWLRLKDHLPQIQRAIVQGNPAGFVGLPFTKPVAAWLTQQENIDLLQAMLTVTYFQNVPTDELEGGIKLGKLDRQAAHNRLSEFFL